MSSAGSLHERVKLAVNGHASLGVEDMSSRATHDRTSSLRALLRRWWQSAEKPWEALAACMEVRDALATGDPASFVSRLPVQIDGSCNGLQHYAALGRDLDGGFSVNLLPSDRPQVCHDASALTYLWRVFSRRPLMPWPAASCSPWPGPQWKLYSSN